MKDLHTTLSLFSTRSLVSKTTLGVPCSVDTTCICIWVFHQSLCSVFVSSIYTGLLYLYGEETTVPRQLQYRRLLPRVSLNLLFACFLVTEIPFSLSNLCDPSWVISLSSIERFYDLRTSIPRWTFTCFLSLSCPEGQKKPYEFNAQI